MPIDVSRRRKRTLRILNAPPGVRPATLMTDIGAEDFSMMLSLAASTPSATTNTTVLMVGHVTNDGALAGPKTLQHLVDVVLELEESRGLDGNERLLRCCGKNRFGATNVIGRFEVTAEGLRPIPPTDGDGWDKERF